MELISLQGGRTILGETVPATSQPGSIRGDLCLDVGRNVCHGSDSRAAAQREIKLWFRQEELVSWESCQHDWIYE